MGSLLLSMEMREKVEPGALTPKSVRLAVCGDELEVRWASHRVRADVHAWDRSADVVREGVEVVKNGEPLGVLEAERALVKAEVRVELCAQGAVPRRAKLTLLGSGF